MDEPPPVGWHAVFLLVGALSAATLDALDVAAPSVHVHGGSLAAIPHAALLALPLAFLVLVVYRLQPSRRVYAALGLTVLGVLLAETPRLLGLL